MNSYKMTVTLDITVEAYDEADVVEIVEEVFGEGDYGLVNVDSMKVNGIKEV